jgi:hypothetical protein
MTAHLIRLESGSLICRRQQEIRMSAKTSTDERLEALSDRIDRLEARAQASGAEANESMKEQVDALRRQEASARAALGEARDDTTEEADEKLVHLDKRVEMAEHALAANVAEDKKTCTNAMRAHLDDVEALLERLRAKATTKPHGPREEAEAMIGDLRATRHVAEQRLDELSAASGERLREEQTAATRDRAALDRKVDEALEKFG